MDSKITPILALGAAAATGGAALAPMLAGGAGAAGAGVAAAGAGAAGAAAGGTGLTQAALLASSVAPVMGGIGQYQQAQGQKEQAEINAYIGKTRAMQTDVTAREGLTEELATLRATLGAGGTNVGTAPFFNELRRSRGRDQRIEVGNRLQESAGYRAQGRAAGQAGTYGLIGGLAKAGPSLFDLYQLRRG